MIDHICSINNKLPIKSVNCETIFTCIPYSKTMDFCTLEFILKAFSRRQKKEQFFLAFQVQM